MTENPWPQDGVAGTPAAGPRNSYRQTATASPETDGEIFDAADGNGPAANDVAATRTTTSGPQTSTADNSTVETAKGEAAEVARQAADSAQSVAGTAKAEAAGVAAEAKTNARELLQQAGSDLRDQAGAQQQKVAEGLRSLSQELESMASTSDGPGVATDLVRQAAERSSAVAGWLDGRDPGSLLAEVKSFARERPGTFLMLAAGAGILAGRLSRSLSAGAPASAGTGNGTGQGITTRIPDGGVPDTRVPDTGTAITPPAPRMPGPNATTAGFTGTYPPNPLATESSDSDEWPADPPTSKPVADPPGMDPLTGPRFTGSPHDDRFGGGPR